MIPDRVLDPPEQEGHDCPHCLEEMSYWEHDNLGMCQECKDKGHTLKPIRKEVR